MNMQLTGLDGGPVEVPSEAYTAFKTGFRGVLLTPQDAAFEETRQLWNGMIDRRPGLIARCTGTVDVVQAVRFAAQHRLLMSVRSGGHNIAGLATNDGGLMIDMSLLRGTWVDPAGRTARAQAGCTLADLDRETQLHGLAAVLGFVSTTGIAGLTLGGGFGYLTRRHGWTCDTLVSMEVVMADGQVLRARPRSTPNCSGPCAAGAAILASSPPSSTACSRSDPRSWAAPSPGTAPTRARCCRPTATSAPGPRGR